MNVKNAKISLNFFICPPLLYPSFFDFGFPCRATRSKRSGIYPNGHWTKKPRKFRQENLPPPIEVFSASLIIAILKDQTNRKKSHEGAALQCKQRPSWLGFRCLGFSVLLCRRDYDCACLGFRSAKNLQLLPQRQLRAYSLYDVFSNVKDLIQQYIFLLLPPRMDSGMIPKL
jgi:hypothetical protein